MTLLRGEKCVQQLDFLSHTISEVNCCTSVQQLDSDTRQAPTRLIMTSLCLSSASRVPWCFYATRTLARSYTCVYYFNIIAIYAVDEAILRFFVDFFSRTNIERSNIGNLFCHIVANWPYSCACGVACVQLLWRRFQDHHTGTYMKGQPHEKTMLACEKPRRMGHWSPSPSFSIIIQQCTPRQLSSMVEFRHRGKKLQLLRVQRGRCRD